MPTNIWNSPEAKQHYTQKCTTKRWREDLGMPIPENVSVELFYFIKAEKKILKRVYNDPEWIRKFNNCIKIMNIMEAFQLGAQPFLKENTKAVSQDEQDEQVEQEKIHHQVDGLSFIEEKEEKEEKEESQPILEVNEPTLEIKNPDCVE